MNGLQKFEWIKAVGRFTGGLRLPRVLKLALFWLICAVACPVIFTAWLLAQPVKSVAIPLLGVAVILSRPIVLIRFIAEALRVLAEALWTFVCGAGIFTLIVAVIVAAPFALAYLFHAIWIMPTSTLILWYYVAAIDRRTRRTY